jgi:hypothetical protein
MIATENKFKNGEVVHERTNPSQKLIVSRYADRVYYCKVQDAPNRKELVYFERELIADAAAFNGAANHVPSKIGSFQFWSF